LWNKRNGDWISFKMNIDKARVGLSDSKYKKDIARGFIETRRINKNKKSMEKLVHFFRLVSLEVEDKKIVLVIDNAVMALNLVDSLNAQNV
jgi:hypothetical protein